MGQATSDFFVIRGGRRSQELRDRLAPRPATLRAVTHPPSVTRWVALRSSPSVAEAAPAPQLCSSRGDTVALDIHHSMMHHIAGVDGELVTESSKHLILSVLAEGDSCGYGILHRVFRSTEAEFDSDPLGPAIHSHFSHGGPS